LAVDNVYSALIGALKANTTIETQLGHYAGTTTALIKAGVLAETETDRPAITIRLESMEELNPTYGNESFILLVSASSEITSTKIARSIITELDNTLVNIDGFAMWFSCKGLGSNGEPTTNEISTPVTMRVIYRRD